MTKPALTTPLVANMLGLSYRQLDYLMREGTVVPVRVGRYRCWTPDQVHRLQVAAALNDVALQGGGLNSALPQIVEYVFAGPEPSGNYAALRNGTVSYAATVSSLFPRSMDPWGAIVVHMPELWP